MRVDQPSVHPPAALRTPQNQPQEPQEPTPPSPEPKETWASRTSDVLVEGVKGAVAGAVCYYIGNQAGSPTMASLGASLYAGRQLAGAGASAGLRVALGGEKSKTLGEAYTKGIAALVLPAIAGTLGGVAGAALGIHLGGSELPVLAGALAATGMARAALRMSD
jgi:hypothetical protein